MSLRSLFLSLFLLASTCTISQERGAMAKFNYGIKAGFHAVTYDDPSFDIDGYRFDKNCIHSNKIGYTITPFARVTYKRFYLQTEAVLGITHHSFDFLDSNTTDEGFEPNSTVYNLKTYCAQIPLLFGYNFVDQKLFAMSFFTGPKAKFIFTAHSEQEFIHFNDSSLEEVLKKNCYYWEFGLGVKIDKVFFDFVYDLGLSDASQYIISNRKVNIYSTSRRDNVLSFSVGMIF